MIYGFFHPGSGLGNQLHRYVATRVLATEKDYQHSMIGANNFKGASFMDLEMGQFPSIVPRVEMPAGKFVVDQLPLWEERTNYYNPEFNFVEDDTIVDGEFQSIQYFGHKLDEIDKWLKVKDMYIPDDVCVIGFRGGEFAVFPELFLTKEYWAEAKILMLQKNPNMKFVVHTDDPATAKMFFPEYPIIHDVEINWRSMRYAKYAIIANSSFYILPRLLSHGFTVAPRYWARRNIKEWSRPDNYYPQFKYI